jgi:hypothetical protein
MTTTTFTTGTGQTLYRVHAADSCRGACPIHRPSDHAMRAWPLHYRPDRGIFERICPHGVGHPDPDSVRRALEYDEDTDVGVHGCDGCCVRDDTSRYDQ